MNTPQNTVALGIDPGVGGAIVALFPTGASDSVPLDAHLETLDWMRAIVATASIEGWQLSAIVERIGGFVPGRPQPASRIFKLGESYGHAIGVLQALRISFETVPPQTWQREYAVGKHKDYAAHKRALAEIARNLFPAGRVTLKTADATLLAEYCRRQLARRAQ